MAFLSELILSTVAAGSERFINPKRGLNGNIGDDDLYLRKIFFNTMEISVSI